MIIRKIHSCRNYFNISIGISSFSVIKVPFLISAQSPKFFTSHPFGIFRFKVSSNTISPPEDFVGLAVGVGEVKLHKPVVVQGFRHLFQARVDLFV